MDSHGKRMLKGWILAGLLAIVTIILFIKMIKDGSLSSVELSTAHWYPLFK